MTHRKTKDYHLRREISESLHIALPLVVSLLAQVAMETVDTLMLGRLGVKQLAAGALGTSIYITLFIACVVMTVSVGVIIARHLGAHRHHLVSQTLLQGFVIVLLFSVPLMLLMWYANYFFIWIGQDPSVVVLMQRFLRALLWTLPGALYFLILRELASVLGHGRLVMLISVLAIPANALANYILMYGKLGFPALGITGIGLGTVIIEYIMLTALTIYCLSQGRIRIYLQHLWRATLNKVIIKDILHVGWPVSVTLVLEIGMFSIATVLMGFFGVTSLAAHQIVVQCSSITFMIPLGIAQATGLRIGQALGADNPRRAKRAVYIGLGLGLIVAALAASSFLFFPRFIIRLYINSTDHQLINLAVSFLFVAAVFQFLDAIQVISNGALRGYKDTLVPMFLGLLAYWIVGLSSGAAFAFWLGWGGIGLWWGLAIGIAVSGLLLFLRLQKH